MESIVGEDPQLAHEMVKLLGNELLLVRKQLQEAQERLRTSSQSRTASTPNVHYDSLELQAAKSENEELRLQIEQMSAQFDQKPDIMHEEEVNRLTDVLTQKEQTEQDHLLQISNLQEKITSLRAKYRGSKNALAQKEKAEQENICQISEASNQKIASLRAKYRNSKDAHQELQTRLDDLLAKEITVQAHQINTFPNDFLAKSHPLPVGQYLPRAADLRLISRKSTFKLPQSLREVCAADGILRYKHDRITWPGETRTHAIAMEPLHRYDPHASPDLVWGKKGFCYTGIGQKRELFHMIKSGWYYMGTYESVHIGILPFDQARAINPAMAQNISHWTTKDKNLVTPLLYNMLSSMYSSNVLRVEYMALQCVGFNEPLYKALVGDAQPDDDRTQPTLIAIPGQDVRGIKRGSDPHVAKSSKKKARSEGHE